MIVLRQLIIGIALAFDLRLDRGIARDAREMVERPARQRRPVIDDPGQLGGPVRLIIMAIEEVGVGPVERIERKAAVGLERQALQVGEQPTLLRHARRLTPQHRRHRVLGQPVDFIFRRRRRYARTDEPRVKRDIIVTGGKAFGKQGAFVRLRHRKLLEPAQAPVDDRYMTV